uniref:MIP18 family-like domain-containing protein n=1 Tax=Acrobeloides nanus TaxID=290746 RepID=A0A914E313_9BILA
MGKERLDNAAPIVYGVKARKYELTERDFDESIEDPIDAQEVFDYIRDINDPEHPYSLEQLNVVQEDLIKVYNEKEDPWVDVQFTPTIPHCSMATLIGLAIKVKLSRSLPPKMKTVVRITPGSHNTEEAINRQLADKERVAAAMENPNLMSTVNQCLVPREE